MRDVILALTMIIFLALGYVGMGRVGKFLEDAFGAVDARRSAAKRTQAVLTGYNSPEEIAREAERFSEEYGRSAVIVFLSEDSEFYDRFAMSGEYYGQ